MTTVLVVDDEPLIAMALEAALEDEGYQVVTAVNGRQALERLGEGTVDIILLDMMMPVMNGPAFLQEREKNPLFSRIPVIVLSSLPQATIRERASGMNAIVSKPYTARDVISTIRAVLDGAAL
ncbi:MAG: response regulator [Acetobacteraceae bacterium]